MFASLRRALPRLFVLFVAGVAFIVWSTPAARLLDPVVAPILFNFGLCLIAIAASDAGLRMLQPGVDPQAAAAKAIATDNIAAGLVYLGRCILAGVLVLMFSTSTRAETVLQPPAAAAALLPVLQAEQRTWWPDMPLPSALGAQVEQETCISLKHRFCWNPRAELKTAREYGFGLGQITVTDRFNVFEELRGEHAAALGDWAWEKRYDAGLQLRALVLKDRSGYRQVVGAADPLEQLAFAFAAYNGGAGGVRSDRRMCAATQGCDQARWFGHVERTSLKAKRAVQGYGKSFFEINREYVRNVLQVRRVRYLQLDA